jgi:hypothetical protein
MKYDIELLATTPSILWISDFRFALDQNKIETTYVDKR